jgi:hypothetical protein
VSRRIEHRLERLESLVDSSGQVDDSETRALIRESLERLAQARLAGELSEEDRAEIRAKIDAVRSLRGGLGEKGKVVNGGLQRI